MKTNSLKILRISVLILGWLLAAGALMGIWRQVILHNQVISNLPGQMIFMSGEFHIENALESFFSGMGNVFFAFLIAAVVRMIEKHVPVEIQYANRLMIVCCLSYLIEALIRLYGSIQGFLAALGSVGGSNFFFLPALVVPAITPLLYAASIYALYRHFTNMVQFESEVA